MKYCYKDRKGKVHHTNRAPYSGMRKKRIRRWLIGIGSLRFMSSDTLWKMGIW